MAQFCVHRLPDGGLVLDCQSELLDHLTTRLVVPLAPVDLAGAPMAVLNPRFDIDGAQYQMMTQFSSAVSARHLGRTVTSLADQDYIIMRALDMLITGY